jgi:hypothetical protein
MDYEQVQSSPIILTSTLLRFSVKLAIEYLLPWTKVKFSFGHGMTSGMAGCLLMKIIA